MSELDAALSRSVDDTSVTDSVRTYLKNHFSLSTGQTKWAGTLTDVTTKDINDGYGTYVYAAYDFTPPNKQPQSTATLDYTIVLDHVITHSVLVYLKPFNGSQVSAGVIEHDFVNNTSPELTVTLENTQKSSFVDSIVLGINHLRLGYDHILFLVSLILIAPFTVIGHKWVRTKGYKKTILHVLGLSLAFTLGHSLSLLIGSFLTIAPIEASVEVLIAVTIGLSAFHALRPVFGRAELLIVLLFGLVHGLAFSSVLFSANISLVERLQTTLAFNVGLELCQIIIVCIALPLYLLVLRFDTKGRSRMIFAVIAILCAVIWIVERLVTVIYK